MILKKPLSECLLNAVQLNVPDEVAELREEVADECRKFGTVV
jgi:hypothetical protein